MNTNEWYIFEGGTVDKKICNKIKKWASNKWVVSKVDVSGEITAEERITGKKRVHKSNSVKRISDVAWCSDQWLYDIIWPYMEEGNRNAGWNYNIKSAEAAQITRYKKDGFYDFHRDGLGDHLSAYDISHNDFLRGHVRKLSMSVILNSNFEGGEFEFASYYERQCNITAIPVRAGSVILFPSSMEHRVAPVTKGIRYSVVCWFLGPPFV